MSSIISSIVSKGFLTDIIPWPGTDGMLFLRHNTLLRRREARRLNVVAVPIRHIRQIIEYSLKTANRED